MPHAINDWPACGAGETVTRSFVFSNGLAPGETIVGSPAPTVTISVIFGPSDPEAQSRMAGGPTINTADGSTEVGILFGGGGQVAGSTYQAGQSCTVQASFTPLAPGVARHWRHLRE